MFERPNRFTPLELIILIVVGLMFLNTLKLEWMLLDLANRICG